MFKRFIILAMLMLICAVSYAQASVNIYDSFSSFNSTTWANISAETSSYINIKDGAAWFYGNKTSTANWNQGVYLESKQSISGLDDGLIQVNIKMNDTMPANDNFQIGLGVAGCSSPPGICNGVSLRYTGTANRIDVLDHITNAAACGGVNLPLDTASHQLKIVASRDGLDTDFDVYVDGAILCSVTQAALITKLNVSARFFGTGNSYHSIQIDELYFTDNATAMGIKLSLGESCGHDGTLCESGACEYGFCALNGARKPCSSDSQCLSGICSEGLCTQAGIWTQINYGKTQQLGSDTDSNNFIAMFLMIGIAVMCIVGSRGAISGVLVGGGLFFVMGIFFTIVGWLSPFIMVGMFFVALALIVLLWIMNSG
jgi:hypothetical protein